jgi:hypothetical protein
MCITLKPLAELSDEQTATHGAGVVRTATCTVVFYGAGLTRAQGIRKAMELESLTPAEQEWLGGQLVALTSIPRFTHGTTLALAPELARAIRNRLAHAPLVVFVSHCELGDGPAAG